MIIETNKNEKENKEARKLEYTVGNKTVKSEYIRQMHNKRTKRL